MSEKLRRLLAIQLFWCVPTTVGALGMYRLPWPDRLFVQAIMWMSWSIPTVIVFLVGDRWPPSRAHAGRTLLLALGLGALCIPGEILITVLTWIHWGMIQGPVLSALVRNLRAVGDSFLVTYVGILLAFVALRWFDQWRQALVVNARLGEDLARAQLDALRAQVNPHFLFNALASVVALIGRDPAAAERTVVALADLLRGTLALADRQEIALDEELDVARRYLAIEQTRFGDRLEVRWDVPAEVLG
ncbi:MAG: histidine kinase, partial [Gemmatimonadetes bacterium]|nr:histidine kinase [Gemmatimonadota bacterium]